jgi:hypothetical protein
MPILIFELTLEEVDEICKKLFLQYCKDTNRKESEFRCLCCSDGEHETWKFEQWVRKKNPTILPSILAFDEKYGEDYGTSFASPIQQME